MSPITKDIFADLVLPELNTTSSRQVLQILSAEVAFRTTLDSEILFEQLLSKEQQSTSGIGGGVAIAHLQSVSLSEPFLMLARLKNKINFDAVDHQDVDLVALLLSPAQDGAVHLRRLSRLSRILKSESLCANLRGARDAHEIRALLGTPETWLMAA